MSNTAGGAISQSVFGRSLVQRTAALKSSIRTLPRARSQLELLTSAERALDALAQLTDLLADVGIHGIAAAAQLEQLMREVQRGHHSDAVQADDVPTVADLAHLDVQVLGGIEQLGALFGEAGDLVFLLEDPHADSRRALRHALCSIAFRRPIIASTRARTCSFFCSSVARSAIIESCRWRRARFSSCSCEIVPSSSSSRSSSCRSSCSMLIFGLIFGLASLMQLRVCVGTPCGQTTPARPVLT